MEKPEIEGVSETPANQPAFATDSNSAESASDQPDTRTNVELVLLLPDYYTFNDPFDTDTTLASPLPDFYSFAPRKGPNQVKWLIDGENYMSAVADAIKAAEHEIFIAGWQIHPYVHLKRPATGVTNLDWRLDTLLKEKPDHVRIYILLYKEPRPFVNLGSKEAHKKLNKRNIIFCRNRGTDPRWSHHEKLVVVDRKIAFVGGIDLCFGRWDTNAHRLTDDYSCHDGAEKTTLEAPDPTVRYRRWVGKDYRNKFVTKNTLDEPFLDITTDEGKPIRTTIPRLPYHDVSCMFNGEAVIDVAQHFIQRFNAACREKISESPDFIPNISASLRIEESNSNDVEILVVRSVGNWSADQPLEASIHDAYCKKIENAQHSVYIENQFFISSQDGEVFNGIQRALAKRIFDAYKRSEDFHVMIILPLLPEFKREFGSRKGRLIKTISYLNYATLFHGEDSLWERLLSQKVPQSFLEKCISVYGLRTHAVLNNKLVTELVYVHSKLMIVDDRITIIGSANINDRSMFGNRDSEVAVVIEDHKMIPGTMNGKPFKVGEFSHSLRCQLMKEHLGNLVTRDNLLQINVKDPVSETFLHNVSKRARDNTEIYEEVFKCIPTNQVTSEKQLNDWIEEEGLAESDLHQARVKLERICGHIVDFPRTFLKDMLKPDPWLMMSSIPKSMDGIDMAELLNFYIED